MYYDLTKENRSKNVLFSIGSIEITSQQIQIGVIIELFTLIPSLFLVQLFQRINPDKNSNICKDSKLPWWFVYVGYGLSMILIGLSIFFIVARGIEFGDLKTQQWLVSILTSWFSSICLTQPIKVLFSMKKKEFRFENLDSLLDDIFDIYLS